MTEYPGCDGLGLCDDHCAVCGSDELYTSVTSYRVQRWDPRRRTFVTTTVLCSACWERLPLP